MAYKDLQKKKEAAARHNDRNAQTYDRLNILVAKGKREEIKAHAESKGQSLNGYVVGLIEADMENTSQEITEPGDVSRA